MSVLLQFQNDGFVDRMQNAIENAFVDSAGFLLDALVAVTLDTMEIHVGILYAFGEAFAFGLALALAIGIAFGWGGKDYVAENLDDWHEEAKTD